MKKIFLITIAVFIAIQFIRPQKKNPPADEDIKLKAPENVENILRRSCYDCHSNETKWPWYSDIAPFSWSVISHVNDARDAFNFSEYEKIPSETRVKRLKRAIKTVNNSMMPPSSYLWFHEDAKLSKNDKETLSVFFKKELQK